ncbi:hypothetical protein C9F09_29180, partial [Salmonella enterica subsp. enterica serovar Wilhelmsburg]
PRSPLASTAAASEVYTRQGLAHVLGPVIIPVYEMLGANPSMFAGTLLACDMGGFFLAKELAGGDVAAWLYSGLIRGSMMGP